MRNKSKKVNVMKTLAIIVNFKSALMTLSAVKSIIDSDTIGPVKIVVLDNSEDTSEADFLRLKLPQEVILIVNSQNIGFARSCNLAYQKYDSDLILLLNPDAQLRPKALLRLQKQLVLSNKVAAVGPNVFWDIDQFFFITPSSPLFILFLGAELHNRGMDDIINRLINAWWRRYMTRVLQSKHPVKVNNLSGGHVLLQRKAVQNSGGLFDPMFFLYYEDTDLFVRLQKSGYKLLTVPYARCVHYYNQCDKHNVALKQMYMKQSHQQFIKKHGARTKSIKKILGYFKSKTTEKNDQLEIPCYQSEFKLNIPKSFQNEWLFELSPNPNFIPSICRFGKGPQMNFSKACWDLLASGLYFGIVGNFKGLETNYHRINCLKNE